MRPTDRPLAAIASGAFVLGFSEFSMMGVLTPVADDLGVSVPWAGNFVSAYALGVCLGTLILVLGRRLPPKPLLVALCALMALGNACAALSPTAHALVLARVLAGLPHGAFYGLATIVCRRLATPGEQGRAVGIMVLGQTLANTVGVPLGTFLAGALTWRAAFGFDALVAVTACLLVARLVPQVDPVPDAGLLGQFRFLRAPGPWLVMAGVALGNGAVLCWWSYVHPWLVEVGGLPEASVPAMLVLAGLGMVAGSQAGARAVDAAGAGKAAAGGQALACAALVLNFLVAGASPIAAATVLFLCCLALFFPSSAQQNLMVEVAQGGGEMAGSACVQIAYNGGNAVGSALSQAALNAGAPYVATPLVGVPMSALSVVALTVFALRFEPRYRPGSGR